MEFELWPGKRLAMPIMTYPGIDLIGKTVHAAVTDGKVHADAICALASNTPSDAATVIMDLTVEAEAFGAKLHYSENEVPSVVKPLLHTFADVKMLTVPSLHRGRVGEYIAANTLAVKHITDRPVLAGCIGPYSLAARLYDMTELMMAIYLEPDLLKTLLEKTASFILSYIRALKETGVAGVIVAEPAAGLLSNDDAVTYSTSYVRRIVDEFQDSHFRIILHNCGNTGHCTPSMIESGAAALHFGNQCNIQDVLRIVPSGIIVMGNLDPVKMCKASSETVYECTAAILQDTKTYSNFILSTGCDVPPGIPWQNIEAFYKAVNDYRMYTSL